VIAATLSRRSLRRDENSAVNPALAPLPATCLPCDIGSHKGRIPRREEAGRLPASRLPSAVSCGSSSGPRCGPIYPGTTWARKAEGPTTPRPDPSSGWCGCRHTMRAGPGSAGKDHRWRL
jgi:hypothetical protein